MMFERALGALAFVMMVSGCGSSGSSDDTAVDAGPPQIAYERFTSVTWSLATAGGRAQLSISDTPGTAACALSTDQHNSLGAAGVQIILQLPSTVTEICPQGKYQLEKCPADLGTAAFVPAGCAFYRKFDAQGNIVGI